MVKTHIKRQFVAELISQLPIGSLKVVLLSAKSPANLLMPLVHVVDSSGHCEGPPFSKPSKPSLSLFVYVTPLMSNDCPTAALGHMTVTPLDARNPGGGGEHTYPVDSRTNPGAHVLHWHEPPTSSSVAQFEIAGQLARLTDRCPEGVNEPSAHLPTTSMSRVGVPEL